MAKRIFLIVLDSFGIGAEPDAPAFGDAGTNTLGAIAGHPNFKWDQLARLGMFNLDGVTCGTKLDAPVGCYARLREASAGKDTTIGHWEIAGLLRAISSVLGLFLAVLLCCAALLIISTGIVLAAKAS